MTEQTVPVQPVTPPGKVKKVLILVNPKSGSFKDDVFQKALDDIIKKHGEEFDIQAEVYHINSPEEVSTRVKEALDSGFKYFAAAGGDGTVAMLADQIKNDGLIGIIPTGTGNVIARVLGIPMSIEEALEVLLTSPKTRTIDGLTIGGRLYLMGISMGFSSSMLRDIDSKGKSRFGRLAYVMAALKQAFNSKTVSAYFDIQIDGVRWRLKAAEVMVINTAPWGMTRYKIPENQIDDGQVEVCIVARGALGDMLNALIDIVVRERKVAVRYLGQGKEVEIQCQRPMDVQADGDIVGVTPISIKVIPCVATIVVPNP